MQVHNTMQVDPWKVTVVDTGLNTMTGGRVKRIQKYIGNEPFLLTYGDGVSNVDIDALLKFHQSHGKIATITTVNVGQKFGVIDMSEDGTTINSFREKNDTDGSVINGGFMVFNPQIFDHIAGDDTVLEKSPMEELAAMGELKAFKHNGFWHCMDTKRDKDNLERLWESGNAPWKIWNER